MDERPLREDIFKILSVLASRDDLSQRGLSNHLGISLGKTNYLLKSLAHRGLVMIRNFTSGSQKINKVKYVLTKEGIEERLRLISHFLQVKEREYLELKKELEKSVEAVKNTQEDLPYCAAQYSSQITDHRSQIIAKEQRMKS